MAAKNDDATVEAKAQIIGISVVYPMPLDFISKANPQMPKIAPPDPNYLNINFVVDNQQEGHGFITLKKEDVNRLNLRVGDKIRITLSSMKIRACLLLAF